MSDFGSMVVHGGQGALREGIDARRLHEALGNSYQYANWIQQRVEELGLEEGADYYLEKGGEESSGGDLGGRRRDVYILTVSAALEAAAMERGEAGLGVRRSLVRMLEAARECREPLLALAGEAARRLGDGRRGLFKKVEAWGRRCLRESGYSKFSTVSADFLWHVCPWGKGAGAERATETEIFACAALARPELRAEMHKNVLMFAGAEYNPPVVTAMEEEEAPPAGPPGLLMAGLRELQAAEASVLALSRAYWDPREAARHEAEVWAEKHLVYLPRGVRTPGLDRERVHRLFHDFQKEVTVGYEWVFEEFMWTVLRARPWIELGFRRKEWWFDHCRYVL